MAVEIRQLVVKATIVHPPGGGSSAGTRDGVSMGTETIERCRAMIHDLIRQGQDR